MRESQPSAALPAPMARRRSLILASAISSVVLIPGGIFVNYHFPEVANNDVLSLLAMFTSSLAPLLGMSAALMAAKDLERIRRSIIPLSVRSVTMWGQILGIAGVGGNLILLVVFLVQAFSFTGPASAKDSMIHDLNRLVAHAYQYRRHPASKRGVRGCIPDTPFLPSWLRTRMDSMPQKCSMGILFNSAQSGERIPLQG